jgi:outer membrane protein insertion porin family
LDHEEPSYRFVAVEGSRDLVDLEYMVQEGRVVEFNISGGIDSNDGAFGLISLSMKNFDISDTPSKWTRTFSELFRKEAFHGAGQRVDIELSPGTKVSRSRLHFLEPDIFNRYIEPISFDVEYRRQLRGYQAYDEQRTDVAVKFGRKFGFDTSVSMGLVQSSVNVSDLNPSGVPVALEQQNAAGVLDLTGITFDAYTRSLDSIVNPHNGWKASLRNTLYADILPNDAEYWRMDLQTDGYMATGTLSNGTEHFLHLEIDGGIMPTFGNTSQVPYTERFQIGGSNSIRGFEYRGAGARGVDVLGAPTKYAAGGESFMGTTLAWIYPLWSTTQPGS